MGLFSWNARDSRSAKTGKAGTSDIDAYEESLTIPGEAAPGSTASARPGNPAGADSSAGAAADHPLPHRQNSGQISGQISGQSSSQSSGPSSGRFSGRPDERPEARQNIHRHEMTTHDVAREESWVAADLRLRDHQEQTAAAARGSDAPRSARPSLALDNHNQRERGGFSASSATDAGEEEDTVHHLSPFAIKLQEKQHQLDGLKTRLGSLTQAFDQMNSLYMESRNSISMLTDFLETSRVHVETEIRLKSENAKISTDLLDANHKTHSLTNQLAEAQAELHALRKRHTETRTALETARNELISIRDNNKKVNEQHKAQSLELLETRQQAEDLRGALGDLEGKYQTLESHAENVQASLEELAGREKHLQQKLSESANQLDEEVKRNNVVTTQLEAAKRQNSSFRNHSIDLKSQLDVAQQELSYAKSRLEEEQRKHDNEVYNLKSEVETLSSQRRVSSQSLQEMSKDNATLKDRNRNLVKRMQEIEHLLGSAQKNHERDRNELVTASEKLRELNLRYNAALTDLNHQRNQSLKYADRIEDLVQENKKLQNYKLQVDLANEQIVQLKGLVHSYQYAMEGRGPAEELGLTTSNGPFDPDNVELDDLGLGGLDMGGLDMGSPELGGPEPGGLKPRLADSFDPTAFDSAEALFSGSAPVSGTSLRRDAALRAEVPHEPGTGTFIDSSLDEDLLADDNSYAGADSPDRPEGTDFAEHALPEITDEGFAAASGEWQERTSNRSEQKHNLDINHGFISQDEGNQVPTSAGKAEIKEIPTVNTDNGSTDNSRAHGPNANHDIKSFQERIDTTHSNEDTQQENRVIRLRE